MFRTKSCNETLGQRYYGSRSSLEQLVSFFHDHHAEDLQPQQTNAFFNMLPELGVIIKKSSVWVCLKLELNHLRKKSSATDARPALRCAMKWTCQQCRLTQTRGKNGQQLKSVQHNAQRNRQFKK